VKGWKKIFQPNAPWKQARVVMLISDKIYFKLKLVRRDKESHSILIHHQELILIININPSRGDNNC
jgi:hypothetical protein